MHEVRVYDSSGTLKKVITEKALKARADQQILFPSAYGKGRKKTKPRSISSKIHKQAKSS